VQSSRVEPVNDYADEPVANPKIIRSPDPNLARVTEESSMINTQKNTLDMN